MAERRARSLGLAGLLAAIAVGSLGEPAPSLPFQGEVRVDGSALLLDAGARIELGKGKQLAAHGEGQSWELGLGELGAARYHEGKIQLVDLDGHAMVSVVGRPVPTGQDPWLRCEGRLEAGAGSQGLDHGPSRDRPCGEEAAWIRALSPLRLEAATLDQQPVPLRSAPRPSPTRAGLALLAGALLALMVGPARLWPLLLSPLALLLPVPGPAVLAVLAGASGVVRGGGRGYGLALISLVVAASFVLARPTPLPADSAAAQALTPMVGPAMLQHKVDEMQQATAPALAAASRPLIVALGGSSSGGGTHGRYWPQILQERLEGRASVVSLAWGGATTWHLLRLMEQAQVQADICVLYVGHNDLSLALPGRSIREILANAPATQTGIVAPVPLADARANILAMRPHCAQLLAIQERVSGRDPIMAEYGAMLSTLEGVRWADGQTLVRASDLMDDVHLHPRGHETLAVQVHREIEEWLGQP